MEQPTRHLDLDEVALADALAAALGGSAASAELRSTARWLAHAIRETNGGTALPSPAAPDQLIGPIVAQLAGRTLSVGDRLLDFSHSQIGDITIRDIAGRDINHITVVVGEQVYEVSGANPYPGMQPLEQGQGHLLIGRADEIQNAVKLLTDPGKEQALCFVTGVSGSGKSSFARAGLLPALEQLYRARQLSPRSVVFRPSSMPINGLLMALQSLGLPPYERPVETLLQQPATIAALIAEQTPPGQVNILLIDQFEELFTQSEAVQRTALLKLLHTLTSFKPDAVRVQLRTHIILTLRLDYVKHLFEPRELYDAVKDGVELRTLDRPALQAIIEHPLQDSGKRFQPELLEALLRDAAQPGSLPLLQATLRALWNGGSLRLSKYRSLTDVISAEADQIYEYASSGGSKRSKEDRAAILEMLLRLVQVSPDNAQHDVRRQRSYDHLTDDKPQRRALCEQLINARLLVASGEEREAKVDIIHEALLRSWDTLVKAIEAKRQALAQRTRFEQALAEWSGAEPKQRAELLLNGLRFAEAIELHRQHDVAFTNPAALQFFEQSKRRATAIERGRTIVRLGGGVVGAGLGYSVGFAVPLITNALLELSFTVADLLSVALLGALYMFPVGVLTGLALALALAATAPRTLRVPSSPQTIAAPSLVGENPAALLDQLIPFMRRFAFRLGAVVLAGAVANAIGLFLFIFGQTERQPQLIHIFAGALMGACLGIGTVLPPRWRVAGLIVAGGFGFAGAALLIARYTDAAINSVAALIGGLILGAFFALGFRIAEGNEEVP
jgi:hypothetical protein